MHNLLPHHRDLLNGSGCSAEVIEARQPFSATKKVELGRLGFSRDQQLVGLVLPSYDVRGEIALHCLRPDKPRLVKGKRRKYEVPVRSRPSLDVHPFLRERIRDPKVPLLITEGIRKADSAVSRGYCCIALLGVWNWRGKNAWAGITALADWEYIALKGRRVYLAFDSDVLQKSSVHAALSRLKRFLEHRGAEVFIIYFPSPTGEKVALDDWLTEGHTAEELFSLASDELRPLVGALADSSGLPSIIVSGRPLREVTTDTVRVLEAANDPAELFERGGMLTRDRIDEKGRPFLEAVTEPALRGRMTRTANFVAVSEQGERHVPPPLDVTRDILSLRSRPFPALVGLTEAPILRPDGTLCDTPGYDAATGLLYRPAPGFCLPPLPVHPDQAAAMEAARWLLTELFIDFPFASAADKANGFALLLTSILRPAIRGQVMMAAADAPRAGSGKGLFLHAGAIMATGRPGAVLPTPKEDEEWRKLITSLLAGGMTFLMFDNLAGLLDSPSLARALTSAFWSDRLLGTNQSVTYPQRATWAVTGNNIRLGGDLPRRCYRIRLNAKLARPWERVGFHHDPLLDWVAENRGTLLAHVFTMARAWFAAGCPKAPTPIIGGFVDWCRVMGGILTYAGVDGFLGNMETLYAEMDEGAPQWEAFLAHWVQQFGPDPVTSRQIAEAVDADPDFLETLPDTLSLIRSRSPGAFVTRLGYALKAQVDTRYGPLKVQVLRKNGERETVEAAILCLQRGADETSRKVALWQVEVIESYGDLGSSGGFSTQRVAEQKTAQSVDVTNSHENGVESPPLPPDSPTAVPETWYHLITRSSELPALLAELVPLDRIHLDVETTALDPADGQLSLIQIATDNGVWVVDCMAGLDLTSLYRVIEARTVVAHNAGFEARWLWSVGCVPERYECTQLKCQVLHCGRWAGAQNLTETSLSACAARELDGLVVDKKHQDSDWSVRPLSADQLQYAAFDAWVLRELDTLVEERLALANLTEVAALECRALPTVAVASAAGVGFDRERWGALAALARVEKETLKAELEAFLPPDFSLLPRPINWGSGKQRATVLESFGLTLPKTPKGNPSTNADALAALDHPMAPVLLALSRAAARGRLDKGDWVDKVRDGRLYTTWHLMGGQAGRMSASHPNVQGVPRAEEPRRCFVAAPGHLLVKTDYSQMELMLAAVESGDEAMIETYAQGGDLHTKTARAILGRDFESPEEMKRLRQVAKAINFGLLYGGGPDTLKIRARTEWGVEMTLEEAKAYRDQFRATYPGLYQWQRRVGNAKEMAITNRAGRRRLLMKRGDDSLYTRRLNTPIQSLGATILKQAMAWLWERRHECPGATPVLFAHDELVVETPEECAETTRAWLETAMREAIAPYVAPLPPVVETTIGPTWAG